MFRKYFLRHGHTHNHFLLILLIIVESYHISFYNYNI